MEKEGRRKRERNPKRDSKKEEEEGEG